MTGLGTVYFSVVVLWSGCGCLSVTPDLELAVLQARAALVAPIEGVHRSRRASGIRQFIQNSAVSGLLPTVTDHSGCSSLAGPVCLLTQSLATESPLLDGVRFGERVLRQWDTMLSMP